MAMASSTHGISQVNSFLVVRQYYPLLKKGRPDLLYQFYHFPRSMIFLDGNSSRVSWNLMEIHSMIKCIGITEIEITTLNSLPSFSGWFLTMVTELLKTTGFTRKGKFTQSFFFAPVDNCFYIHNDIFHIIGEEDPASITFTASSSHQEAPDYQGQLWNTIGSFRDLLADIDESVDLHHQDASHMLDNAVASVDEPVAPHDQAASHTQDHTVASVGEPAEDPQKITYASTLKMGKQPAQQRSEATKQPSSSSGAPGASEPWGLHEPAHVSSVEDGVTSFGRAFVDCSPSLGLGKMAQQGGRGGRGHGRGS